MLILKFIAYFKKECFALRCAVAGLVQFFLTERKTIVYTIATIIVLLTGLFCHLNGTEWILLSASIISVWVAEMFNTCIEEILNLLHPAQHTKVKRIKDIAAGAVLFTAVGSIITGLIIFLPKLFFYVHR